MSRWFRLYEEVVRDPKVQTLSDRLFKTWINLLCLASVNNGKICIKNGLKGGASFVLARRQDYLKADIEELVKRGLFDVVDENLIPHKWFERQYKSDLSTPRVNAFRKRQGNVSSAVSATPPEYRVQKTEKKERKQEILTSSVNHLETNGSSAPSKDSVKESGEKRDAWVELGVNLIKLFEDTSGTYIEVRGPIAKWKASGFDPDIIFETISGGLIKNPRVTSLKYFENQILEAHGAVDDAKAKMANRNPIVRLSSQEMSIPYDIQCGFIKSFKERGLGSWPPFMGPPPGDPACKCSSGALEFYGYSKGRAA